MLNCTESLNEMEDLGATTRGILTMIAFLDDNLQAQTWNLRGVALASAAALGSVRVVLKQKYGIEWYSFFHAVVTGAGSVACVYLDVFAAELLAGTAEPLRSCQCQGPLTSMHRFLPAITIGYGLLDVFEGFGFGWDFLMHGIVTFCVMGFFVELDVPEFVTPMLLMELSTIFLTIRAAEFFPDAVTLANQILFALNFFCWRLVVVPFFVWYKLMKTMWQHRDRPESPSPCLPMHVFVVSVTVGIFFHVLNLFWFYKIVRKARRKLLGQEAVKQNELEPVKMHTCLTPSSSCISDTNGASPPRENGSIKMD